MATRDSTSHADVVESVRPQVATADVEGETVDLRGSDSVLFAVTVGAINGGNDDSVVTIEESTDDSTFTDVADADILGSEPTLAADTAYQFGYIGTARYVRGKFGIGTETDAAVSVVAVRTHLHSEPDGYNVESVI